MDRIVGTFQVRQLAGEPGEKTALLVNPPVYDTQYWAQWSLPYGLLRIGALLKKAGYKRVEFFDFMETPRQGRRVVPQHRINPNERYDEQEGPVQRARPLIIEKGVEALELFKLHLGKPWSEFYEWLDAHGFTTAHPPDEIYISAIMTYWWEAVRDLVSRLKRRFPTSTVILGGIYPSLCPEHAAQYTAADVIAVGEVREANSLWPDLSLCETPPSYTIVTPARGCPYNCAYCAQKALNDGRNRVEYRPTSDIVAEMRYANETYGIKDFALYADYLSWQPCFEELLQRLSQQDFYFRLYAPEGFDPRPLAQSPRLAELMKATRLQKVYLALENMDGSWLGALERHHAALKYFIQAARNLERAGFPLRNMSVNAFVLYGLPGETVDSVVRTALFANDVVGSIIPMLFTPVPTTAVYQQHLPFIQAHGWDRDLHMLNGKLYPFLQMNEGSLFDYVDLQRMMFMLNTQYRSRSFRVFGQTQVGKAFRESLAEVEGLAQGESEGGGRKVEVVG